MAMLLQSEVYDCTETDPKKPTDVRFKFPSRPIKDKLGKLKEPRKDYPGEELYEIYQFETKTVEKVRLFIDMFIE